MSLKEIWTIECQTKSIYYFQVNLYKSCDFIFNLNFQFNKESIWGVSVTSLLFVENLFWLH